MAPGEGRQGTEGFGIDFQAGAVAAAGTNGYPPAARKARNIPTAMNSGLVRGQQVLVGQ